MQCYHGHSGRAILGQVGKRFLEEFSRNGFYGLYIRASSVLLDDATLFPRGLYKLNSPRERRRVHTARGPVLGLTRRTRFRAPAPELDSPAPCSCVTLPTALGQQCRHPHFSDGETKIQLV